MSNSSDTARDGGRPAKIQIAGAADLFRHLRDPRLEVRLSVLATISRLPQKALAYGPHNGTDLLSELFQQVHTQRHRDLRQALLGTLSVFRDERVAPAFQNHFRATRDDREAWICARRLACEPGDRMRSFFLGFLRRHPHPPQSRCAANILARETGHAPADAVRIAVHCDVPFPTPPLDDTTEAAWLDALQETTTARTTLILLESLGPHAYHRLRERWTTLGRGQKQWLLAWGARAGDARAVELCLEALQSCDAALQLAALQAIEKFGAARYLFRHAAAPFVEHPDKAIAAAALRAGAAVPDPAALLHRESDPRVRRLLVARLAEAQGEAAIPALSALLADNDWRIRNQAADALASLGPRAAAAVADLTEDDREEVRVAARQVVAAHADACAEPGA
ncbi:HEAT repeat domain-containing protein [Desulfatitalea alkaliphila]|uniref:HEAT repeat domain-containing protein n=1 Tax=Desulfatitalea alkaliphila TaxID=2929485 RepID=A0AA41QZ75_9BACT|nr:HEAT repeat domain-containing protein [Desulfatitalea alkaliphila]MCJ8498954.1 HEAT repeat domain-containing protein [Desulfatitalea alkaliphila]